MTDIANRVGLIYKIVCNDLNVKECYVGSCQAFRARKRSHKSICNNENSVGYNLNIYQFIRANGGWDNFSMLQIETVMFREKRELQTKERHWIETLGATLNRQIPSRTQQEYKVEHKEQLIEYRKQRYQSNKTEILEQQKAYYTANRTEKLEKAKELVLCECGKSSMKSNLSRHKLSKDHRQYEKVYNFIYS